LEEPLFEQIVGTPKYFTTYWENFLGYPKNNWLYNTNRFIKSWHSEYWSAVYGVKTGTTTDAGQCLVTAAKVGGEDLISVVLFSAPYGDEGPPNRFTDSRTILDHGFEYDYPFN
jgi:D-alanyl-D-alanine carboxypeptidase (penicillin-binding protein 5/6)